MSATTRPELECPVCADSLEAGATRACPRCDTPHHADCWEFTGGCAIFGCVEVPAAVAAVTTTGEPPRPPLNPLLQRWMDAAHTQNMAMLMAGGGICALPLLLVVLAAIGEVEGAMGVMVQAAFTSAMLVPVAGALATLVLTHRQQGIAAEVEAATGRGPGDPKKAMALAHEIDVTGPHARWQELIAKLRQGFHVAYGGAIALGILDVALQSWNGPGGFVGFLAGAQIVAIFLGGFLFLGRSALDHLERDIAARSQVVQTVQNRLVASSKR